MLRDPDVIKAQNQYALPPHLPTQEQYLKQVRFRQYPPFTALQRLDRYFRPRGIKHSDEWNANIKAGWQPRR